MPVAQGHCPNCGAPIEFAIGSSIAKVCEYCRHTVVRSDRGLENLGKVADLAQTPALVGIHDEGTLSGRPLRVMGRVQLDHGAGPWDEYYVAFDHGQSWGWLAYAQGQWFVTSLVPGILTPPHDVLQPDQDIVLGQAGTFRVAEVRFGRVVSAEGELPGPFPAGFTRYYADLWGANNAFATIDYGDNPNGTAAVFLGWCFPETALVVTQLGPRSTNKVRATTLKCPNCGGDVPKLAPDRSERLGCPYCGAVSDIAEQKVISQQEKARSLPIIPIGTQGRLDDVDYVCIATVRRSSEFEGELFEWEEFLLWAPIVGFRWLVLDPEAGWSFVSPLNPAELDLSALPNRVVFRQREFRLRNRNVATVRYVLGEVYWKCEVGETTNVMDFNDGDDVISREGSSREVIWSQSSPKTWAAIAEAFHLPLKKYAGRKKSENMTGVQIMLIVVAFLVLIVIAGAMDDCDDSPSTASGTSTSGTGIFRGGGVYSGGK